jgi:FkbM family methyltransferase
MASWLSSIYRGARDGILMCAWELPYIGSPRRHVCRIDGIELTVRRWTTDRLIVNEVFRKISYPTPGPGDTVLDLGAHIGSFSLLAARAGARVLAFEPDPSNFALLTENARGYPAVEAVPLAVSGRAGRRMMGRKIRCSTSGWSFFEANNEAQTVECISLPDILKRWRLDHVDLLKLNVEGAEYEIIQDTPVAVLQKVRRMFLEFHDCLGFRFSDLVLRLQSAGFQVRVRPQAPFFLTGIGYIDAVDRLLPAVRIERTGTHESPVEAPGEDSP